MEYWNPIRPVDEHVNVCMKCMKITDNLHKIKIGALGYGSLFDSTETQIHLCDDCYNATPEEWWKLEQVQDQELFDWVDRDDKFKDEFMKYKYEEEILNYVETFPPAGYELAMNWYMNDLDFPKSCVSRMGVIMGRG